MAFGAPFERVGSASLVSEFVIDPTPGFDVSHSGANLPLGATPGSDNYIMREGAIEPRPMLSVVSGNGSAQPFVDRVLGGREITSVEGTRYPLVSGTTQLAYFANNLWSLASYVSAGGMDAAPAGSTVDYWDWTQIYDDVSENNIAVGAIGSRQSMYAWGAGSAIFSTLTGAPGAKAVTSFDNYLLAANVIDADGGPFPQRIRWSDRGTPSNWTGGLSGFEDLLSATGAITRLIPLESSVVVFFEDEIWLGATAELPFTFRFTALDTSVGCPYPWTAVNTPRGIMFVGRDFQVYLLSKQGGAAQPIGQPLHRSVRDSIVQPERTFGVYDALRTQYQLYYSTGGAASLPQRAAYLQLDTGGWAPQSFHTDTLELTRGFGTNALSNSASSIWNDFDDVTGATWDSFSKSWDETAGIGNARQTVLLGSSAGTMYELSSTATTDNGTAVYSYWQTSLLQGGVAAVQKSVTRVDVEYATNSASSLTVRTSPSQGAAFSTGVGIAMSPTSSLSQSPAYVRESARYPVVRVESTSQRYRMQRLNVVMRVGGR